MTSHRTHHGSRSAGPSTTTATNANYVLQCLAAADPASKQTRSTPDERLLASSIDALARASLISDAASQQPLVTILARVESLLIAYRRYSGLQGLDGLTLALRVALHLSRTTAAWLSMSGSTHNATSWIAASLELLTGLANAKPHELALAIATQPHVIQTALQLVGEEIVGPAARNPERVEHLGGIVSTTLPKFCLAAMSLAEKLSVARLELGPYVELDEAMSGIMRALLLQLRRHPSLFRPWAARIHKLCRNVLADRGDAQDGTLRNDAVALDVALHWTGVKRNLGDAPKVAASKLSHVQLWKEAFEERVSELTASVRRLRRQTQARAASEHTLQGHVDASLLAVQTLADLLGTSRSTPGILVLMLGQPSAGQVELPLGRLVSTARQILGLREDDLRPLTLLLPEGRASFLLGEIRLIKMGAARFLALACLAVYAPSPESLAPHVHEALQTMLAHVETLLRENVGATGEVSTCSDDIAEAMHILSVLVAGFPGDDEHTPGPASLLDPVSPLPSRLARTALSVAASVMTASRRQGVANASERGAANSFTGSRSKKARTRAPNEGLLPPPSWPTLATDRLATCDADAVRASLRIFTGVVPLLATSAAGTGASDVLANGLGLVGVLARSLVHTKSPSALDDALDLGATAVACMARVLSHAPSPLASQYVGLASSLATAARLMASSASCPTASCDGRSLRAAAAQLQHLVDATVKPTMPPILDAQPQQQLGALASGLSMDLHRPTAWDSEPSAGQADGLEAGATDEAYQDDDGAGRGGDEALDAEPRPPDHVGTCPDMGFAPIDRGVEGAAEEGAPVQGLAGNSKRGSDLDDEGAAAGRVEGATALADALSGRSGEEQAHDGIHAPQEASRDATPSHPARTPVPEGGRAVQDLEARSAAGDRIVDDAASAAKAEEHRREQHMQQHRRQQQRRDDDDDDDDDDDEIPEIDVRGSDEESGPE